MRYTSPFGDTLLSQSSASEVDGVGNNVVSKFRMKCGVKQTRRGYRTCHWSFVKENTELA